MRLKGSWKVRYDLAALPTGEGYFQDKGERYPPGTGMQIIAAEREARALKTERLRTARLRSAR